MEVGTRGVDIEELCLPPINMLLARSDLEALLYSVLFPPLCLLGVVGNALNLVVLLNHEVMSRANCLLACLAMCDIVFLLLIVPHSMANFETVAFNVTFREIYLPLKMHLIALANWCSAIAIWLVVFVCMERVAGVRSPLHSRSGPPRSRLLAPLIVLVLAAGALTFYGHVSHHCIIRSFCHGSQTIAMCLNVKDDWLGNKTNTATSALRAYIRWSELAHALFVVLIPLVLLFTLNLMLVHYVRHRAFLLPPVTVAIGKRMRKKGEPSLPALNPDAVLFRRHSDQRTEHRVAITVCAVVTSFTITQAPSAAVLAVNTLWPDITKNNYWYGITTITSFLVVIGKTMNFIVFCLSSVNFRRKLVRLVKAKYLAGERTISISTSITQCSSRKVSAKRSLQSI